MAFTDNPKGENVKTNRAIKKKNRFELASIIVSNIVKKVQSTPPKMISHTMTAVQHHTCSTHKVHLRLDLNVNSPPGRIV